MYVCVLYAYAHEMLSVKTRVFPRRVLDSRAQEEKFLDRTQTRKSDGNDQMPKESSVTARRRDEDFASASAC